MQIESDVKLDFDDVLIRPKRSTVGSRADVILFRTFNTLNSKVEISGVPIIAANMDTTGTIQMAESLVKYNMFTALHKFYPVELLKDYFNNYNSRNSSFYTVGLAKEDVLKLKEIYLAKIPLTKICVDAANGYTQFFVERVSEIRQMYPHAVIMAGNVSTPEMVQEILIAGGADIVKIGIGPGKVCKTREVTGVGYYQLSAIIECADAAHGLGGLICADGGCHTPGNICKAFGAGADFVMLGSMLAGHDECEGEWEYSYEYPKDEKGVPQLTKCPTRNKVNLKFYGMSSREAMDKYYGGMADYRASEGTCIKVPYKGPVKNTVQQILGGLRSYCTYIGAAKLKDASKCTTFTKNK